MNIVITANFSNTVSATHLQICRNNGLKTCLLIDTWPNNVPAPKITQQLSQLSNAYSPPICTGSYPPHYFYLYRSPSQPVYAVLTARPATPSITTRTAQLMIVHATNSCNICSHSYWCIISPNNTNQAAETPTSSH